MSQGLYDCRMGKKDKNPFNPGTGKLPAHRAGHDEAADCLKEHLEDIRAGHGGDMIALYGPRGNGKTTLLGEHRIRARRLGVRVVSVKIGELRDDPAALAHLLMPGWKVNLGRVRSIMGGAFGFSAGIELGESHGQLEVAMREALRKSPVALIIDEAHTLPAGLGRALLQVAQDCVTDALPLLLTMAGTPDLPSAFRKMGATFWERCRQLQIGRLENEEAARQALAVPAESTGYPIDEDALELLVRESQLYPYFLQVLGETAWSAAAKRSGGGEGPHRITAQDAQAGIEAARNAMLIFYEGRRNEMLEEGILKEAIAVSDAMMAAGGGKALSGKDLMGVLRPIIADEHSRLVARNKLTHLGLIWQRPEGHWEPGIPSLCKHIVSRGIED